MDEVYFTPKAKIDEIVRRGELEPGKRKKESEYMYEEDEISKSSGSNSNYIREEYVLPLQAIASSSNDLQPTMRPTKPKKPIIQDVYDEDGYTLARNSGFSTNQVRSQNSSNDATNANTSYNKNQRGCTKEKVIVIASIMILFLVGGVTAYVVACRLNIGNNHRPRSNVTEEPPKICATTDATTTSLGGDEYEVPDQNKECVFPFKYDGFEYTKCTNDHACHACFWCGTQYGVTDTAGWGLCNTACPKADDDTCTYYRMKNRVFDEGVSLGKHGNKTLEECRNICDSLPRCQSFGYADNTDGVNPNTCWLFDRTLRGNEPQLVWYGIYTVYKICGSNTYRKVYNNHACCISNNQIHQRCHCDGSLSRCKTACDADVNCKGYVDNIWRGPDMCEYATTSDCPNDCVLSFRGNVGELVDGGTCGANYGGCFIKQTPLVERKGYILRQKQKCSTRFNGLMSFNDAIKTCEAFGCSFIENDDCRYDNKYRVCTKGSGLKSANSRHSCVYEKGIL